MGFSATQVDEAFAALGLAPPAAGELVAIEAINGPVEYANYFQSGQEFEFPVAPATPIIAELPEVQAQVVPVVQMFALATGHMPTGHTLFEMVLSGLTQPQLAYALVSSSTFADFYNGGVALNPDAPVTFSLVDSMFMFGLGHAPSAATKQGFAGLTNAQAFHAFNTSETVTQALAPSVEGYLMQVITLATGIIDADPLPADTVTIVGQSSTLHAAGGQILHAA
jgi:hypothetical protein